MLYDSEAVLLVVFENHVLQASGAAASDWVALEALGVHQRKSDFIVKI